MRYNKSLDKYSVAIMVFFLALSNKNRTYDQPKECFSLRAID